MKLSDFDFDLPDNLIALRPAHPRSASRLLVADNNDNSIKDCKFSDIVQFLKAGDRLVINNTKVIPALLNAQRLRQSNMGQTRAKVQINLLRAINGRVWRALAKPAKRLAIGDRVEFSPQFWAIIIDKDDSGVSLRFNQAGAGFDAALAQVGQMPLPPYIAAKRGADSRDQEDYQTVFARHAGAVAAPTAALHFDADLLQKLSAMGISISEITLHVGAGTFLPVKSDDISQHKMHAEWGEINAEVAAQINTTKATGGRIIALGTTALRLLETAAQNGQCHAWQGETDIFITPGYQFALVDGLITNFHLPKSTLLMLVSAFIGQKRIDDIYAHAIAQNYRFFSYGDASLLLPKR